MTFLEGTRQSKPRLQIGRYQVVQPLGQGAMGEVLLAFDPVLDRNVAIKYLRRDLDLSEEHREALIARLWQEARASARVSHPNIVALHDMGEDEDLGPYLVFEHVEGPTLKERVSRGPMDLNQAAALARELGDALAAAHTASVLHRDVKPDNVILRRTGCKIADFGIARLPNSTLTQRGSLLGTPAYSAPETLEGSQFSPLSDQFSLAATLYEAVFARRAFPGDDALQVANRVRLDEPKRLAVELGMDPSIDDVLARALSKNPNDRFNDCAQLGNALSDAILRSPARQTLRGMSGPLDTIAAISSEARPRPRQGVNFWPPLLGLALASVGLYFALHSGAEETASAASSPRPREEAIASQASRSSAVEAKPGTSTTAAMPAPIVVPAPRVLQTGGVRTLKPRSRVSRSTSSGGSKSQKSALH
ncbi:MAG TPA: serine/threonine-protein kinase [Polyangiaceae bacterium]|nr:serine/threonine-protein kinase [Polyangiaceae bacterium]